MSTRPIYIVFKCIALAILIACLWGWKKSADVVNAQLELVRGLEADSIRSLTLYPYYRLNSLINDSVIIKDRQTISRVVNAYKHMRPQKAGDGKLDGKWQVTLAFKTYGRREITSDIYHTDFSDLVFISTPVSSEIQGLGDVLSSQEISQVLLDALARK